MNEEKMSSKHYKDMILESIDQLRERKARPDLERIAHMMTRRYGIANGRTAALLEKLVDTDVVIKVEYKGQISYRNATKWKKRHLVGHILNSNHATKKVIEALEALSVDRPKTDEKGSSADEIAEWLLPKSANKSASKLNVDNNSAASDTVSPPTTSPPKRGRPPSKRKKIQKDHGPDFETELVSKKFSAKSRCDFCLQGSDCNRKGRVEYLLACKDCNAKAHPTCMDYSETLAIRAKRAPWQCIDCKTCYVCSDAGNADCMLFCDACDKGYHMNCHQPEVTEKPLGKWICDDCVYEGVDGTAHRPETLSSTPGTTGDTSGLPTPCDSPQPSTENQDLNPMALMNGSLVKQPLPKLPKLEGGLYPDASDWSIDEVEMFLQSAGFSQQAEAFREQEIDGKSLLLMKRSDVLTGLAIKLGPALKIYQHVKKLQMAGFNVNVP
ncbi:hypothetical protein ScPMuIL_000099 [Solemya velum]